MGFDAQNFDISKLLGTAGGFDLESVTSQQGPSASGLAALGESESKSSGAAEQGSVKQDSPNLPPPGSGMHTSYDKSQLELEDVDAILKKIPESQSFETAAKVHLNNPNYTVAEDVLKALKDNDVEEFAVNLRLLRKMLVQVIQGFLNTNPKAPESMKGALASLQLDVFKENFPTAEFPLAVLSKQQDNVASQFFSDLKRKFEEDGRGFDPLGDSEFTQEALEDLSVEYLIKEGYSEEEAGDLTEKNLSTIGLSKAVSNWSENFTSTLSKTPPEKEETVFTSMSNLQKLIDDSPLDNEDKASILDFMAKISAALEELKAIVNEILNADIKEKKKLLQSKLSTIDSMLELLNLTQKLTPDALEKLSKEIDSKSEESSELAQVIKKLFGVDVKKMSKEEFNEFINGTVKKTADEFNKNKEKALTGMVNTLNLFFKSTIANIKKEEDKVTEAKNKSTGNGVENAFQDQVAQLVKEMVEELSKMGNSGAIPQDSLSKLAHATESLVEQLKKAGIGDANAAEIEQSLAELTSSKTRSSGPQANAIAANDTGVLLSSSIEAGQRLISDLGNGLSPQLATAYLNDMAINTLSLSLFISNNELAGEEVAEALGGLASKSASLGLATGLLSAGAESADVRALLQTAKGLSDAVTDADFSSYLAKELIQATGQPSSNEPLMRGGINGVLGSVGVSSTEEDKEFEETQELIKTLRKAIAILEKTLQNLLFGVESGSLSGADTTKQATQAFKKVYEQMMQALLPDLDKEILDSILEDATLKLEEALEGSTPSAEGAQFLINSMLAAGIGPAQQGLGQGQMGA